MRQWRRPGPGGRSEPGMRSSQASPEEAGELVHRYCSGGTVAPRLVFHVVVLQSPLADGDPMRDADQLEVSKHHARTLAAIIEQHVDARMRQLLVEPIGGDADRVAA